MAYRIDKNQAHTFEPGCLYVVTSLPRRLPYASHNIAGYATSIPEDLDLGKYETDAATGRTTEQFEWSVYYHESAQGGTWYRLVKDLDSYHHGPCPNPKPPVYTLERTKLRRGTLRLQEDVVAIFAVLYLPTDQDILTFKVKSKTNSSSAASALDSPSTSRSSACSSSASSSDAEETSSSTAKPVPTSNTLKPEDEDKKRKKEKITFKVPLYLDWLTVRTAPRAQRTFIWAVSVFLRCRIHLAGYVDTGDNIKAFDIREFLGEALAVCYPEVLMASRPVLPRPVFLSGSSIHMLGSACVGDDDDGSPTIVAVDSIHVCQPHQETLWSSSASNASVGFSSTASAFFSTTTAASPATAYQYPPVVGYGGETLYGSECLPDMFVWPNMWMSPRKTYTYLDNLTMTTTAKLRKVEGKERCDESRAPESTQGGRTRRPRVKSVTTYNAEFPPLPAPSAKSGE